MFSPPYFQSRGITKHAMTLTYAAAFLSDGKWGRYFSPIDQSIIGCNSQIRPLEK